tara:strand:- start:1315 stop:1614 length:300 start_codon:yes stop_codon:yes gene_type:complete
MSENKQSDWKEREVGALWKQSGNGKTSYCTGYITSDELGNKVRQRVIMFANKNKSNDKSPDFIIYISKNLNEEGGSTQVVQRRTASPEFEDVGPQEVPI